MANRIFINHPKIGTLIVRKTRPHYRSKRHSLTSLYVNELKQIGAIPSNIFSECTICKKSLHNPQSIFYHIGNCCEKKFKSTIMEQKLKKKKAETITITPSKQNEITFNIPDIGLGRLTTTATHILLSLLMEENIYEKMGVLISVLEHLEITPDDIDKYYRNQERRGNLDYDNEEPYSWEN